MLTAPLHRGKIPPKSVLDMTLNCLIVRFQSSNLGECRLPFHYHYSQVYSPGLVVPVRVPSLGQIELFSHLTVCKQISSDSFKYNVTLPTNDLLTNVLSSSSCADSTYFPDPLSPSIPIIRCLMAGLLDHALCPHRADVSSCWSANTGKSMCRNSLEEHYLRVCPCFSSISLLMSLILTGCRILLVLIYY